MAEGNCIPGSPGLGVSMRMARVACQPHNVSSTVQSGGSSRQLRVLAPLRAQTGLAALGPRRGSIFRSGRDDPVCRIWIVCVQRPNRASIPLHFLPTPNPGRHLAPAQRPRLCMTGISSLVLRRAVCSLDRNLTIIRCAGRAHVHAVDAGLSPLPHPHRHSLHTMFGKAVAAKAASAANQSSRPTTNKSDFAKQLFPSSSPSPAPGKPHGENTITSMLTRKTPSLGPGGPSRPATTAKPLQNHPPNVPPHVSRNVRRFASVVNRTESDLFEERAEVNDLMNDGPATLSNPTQPSNPASQVYFDDDDISDDEHLDFEAVSALPALPPARSQGAVEKHDGPPPASSAFSWSQSSPSHHRVPPPQQRSSKRASQDDEERIPKATKKPKRELPWPTQPAERYGAAAATPAPKTKASSMLWDSTESAVKAQKKQLKTQLKDSVKAEPSLDDIQEAAKASSKKASALTLSSEQRHVKDLVVEKGQSVFFTGPAGTGKSVLMRAIIQELKKKHARDPERVAVTASTGLAACNIGGMTLHSFSGIGLGKEDTNTLVRKIRRNPKAKNRWLKTKILVIDEISMVDGELFDKLSQIGRTIRNNGRPWGGIQLVITGDFFQLPPVPDGGKQRESKFAFDAATWSMSIDHTIGLTEVFRQRDPGRPNPMCIDSEI